MMNLGILRLRFTGDRRLAQEAGHPEIGDVVPAPAGGMDLSQEFRHPELGRI